MTLPDDFRTASCSPSTVTCNSPVSFEPGMTQVYIPESLWDTLNISKLSCVILYLSSVLLMFTTVPYGCVFRHTDDVVTLDLSVVTLDLSEQLSCTLLPSNATMFRGPTPSRCLSWLSPVNKDGATCLTFYSVQSQQQPKQSHLSIY